VDAADQTAKLAGECAIIRRAIALARWVGPEGKALTRVGVLRKPAVPGACAAIGIRLPERFRSAGDIPGLHRPWTAALALDFGADWVHEVTRMGSSRLAPGEAVPRCLSFSGDNSVEYWNEDEPADPGPFDMAVVNAALAG
jgi:hypothetical protein